MSHRPDRFAELRDRDTSAIAAALGLSRVTERRFVCPNGECPDKAAEPSLGCFSATGWKCHRCDAKGDAPALAAWITTGSTRPPSWEQVLDACSAVGLVSRLDGTAPSLPPAPRRSGPPRPKYPPQDEVEEVWASARAITTEGVTDPGVLRWVEGDAPGLKPRRRIALDRVDALDLARVIPRRAPLPEWARCGRPWSESGYRLIVPLLDHEGVMRSLHARRLVAGSPKGASPKGFTVGGLVMADSAGHALLRGEEVRRWLVIREGLPDYLASTSRWTDPSAARPAIIGIIAGSWTPALAARMPDGCRVVVATDEDPAGDRYAEQIIKTLEDRCEVIRWRAKESA